MDQKQYHGCDPKCKITFSGSSEVKIKQRSIRVFEIECDTLEGADEFIQKNLEILKDYFILLKGKSAIDLRPLVEQYGLTCIVSEGITSLESKGKSKENELLLDNALVVSNTDNKTPEMSGGKEEPHIEVIQAQVSRTLYDRPIRSGEEIIIEGDGTIMGRINGGSRVIVHGNGAFLDQIDGMVICEGSFALVRSIGKGSLIFCGEMVDKDIFGQFDCHSAIKRVSMVEGKLIIKDLG
jgi:septum formation inhibitor MinC